MLAKILSAKFEREALAGETLVYDVEILSLRPEGASILGKVYAGPAGTSLRPPSSQVKRRTHGSVAEIFFAHLDQARSQQIFGDHNFVFSGELKHIMGWRRSWRDQAESK